MARPGIKYDEFVKVIEDCIRAGTPASKVTLKMMAERLSASNSTLVKFRNQYVESHPETKTLARELPIDIVASIESYGDRRERLVRDDLGEQLLQAKASEQALLAETKELGDDLDGLRATADDLATKNATLSGQNAQQGLEITALKAELVAMSEKSATIERGLHAAEGLAHAADGRIDEIRASTDKQLATLQADLEKVRTSLASAEQRVTESEKHAVGAEARLEGERNAKVALEAQLAKLQDSAGQLQADAMRAAGAEASNAGLRDQVTLLDSTVTMLRELVTSTGKGKKTAGAPG